MPRLLTALFLLVFAVSATAAAAPTGTVPTARTVVLVRHGHAVEDPAVDPMLGPPLARIGVAQAHLAGARLAGLGLRFDALGDRVRSLGVPPLPVGKP